MTEARRRLFAFLVLAFLFALTIDLAAFVTLERGGAGSSDPRTALVTMVWGFARMWSVTAAALLSAVIGRESLLGCLKRWLRVSKRSLLCYLSAPLLIYLALGVYVLIAAPFGLFDFDAYVELIASQLRAAGLAEELAPLVAFQQLLLGYFAAISVNAAFALGEELGWRGYMFDLLERRLTARGVVAIGVAWGLWHASATMLLGHNYGSNRLLGGFILFPVFTTLLSIPHMLLVEAADSVLPAASLHGAVNALWGLTVVATGLPLEARELYTGLGLAGFAAWAILDALIIKLRLMRARGDGRA
ncbi:MAG: CPBP family intramembrane glutamic endopeptidase [Thermofilaceae archaeon]